jgi:hypothetical protein
MAAFTFWWMMSIRFQLQSILLNASWHSTMHSIASFLSASLIQGFSAGLIGQNLSMSFGFVWFIGSSELDDVSANSDTSPRINVQFSLVPPDFNAGGKLNENNVRAFHVGKHGSEPLPLSISRFIVFAVDCVGHRQ